jgi:hypothetical protein
MEDQNTVHMRHLLRSKQVRMRIELDVLATWRGGLGIWTFFLFLEQIFRLQTASRHPATSTNDTRRNTVLSSAICDRVCYLRLLCKTTHLPVQHWNETHDLHPSSTLVPLSYNSQPLQLFSRIVYHVFL